MTPNQLKQFLKFSIPNKFNILVTGSPGINSK